MPKKHHTTAPDSKHFPKLPGPQLVAAVKRCSQEGGATAKEMAAGVGVWDRRLREWSKPGALLFFNTADKVLLSLGLHWWDVWTPANSTPEELSRVERAFTGECSADQGTQLGLETAVA